MTQEEGTALTGHAPAWMSVRATGHGTAAALLEAGHVYQALSLLSSALPVEKALILDHSSLFDLSAVRWKTATSGPNKVHLDEPAARTLVEDAAQELLLREHASLLAYTREGIEDDGWLDGDFEQAQLRSFGLEPREARRNAVRFNALPFKTRWAFLAATKPFPADIDPEEERQRLEFITEYRQECIIAIRVLMGTEGQYSWVQKINLKQRKGYLASCGN